MKQIVVTGIILSRTNYAEADRILSVLTPEQGKVRLIAHGARKPKSKLAGGIELFSEAKLTYIVGRSELNTLVSSRLEKHYDTIAQQIDRTMAAYEFIKTINKATEDQAESEWYNLLKKGLELLDDKNIDLSLVKSWFYLSIVRLSGYSPNLKVDNNNTLLNDGSKYHFDYESSHFIQHTAGTFNADLIKLLRLIFDGKEPASLMRISGIKEYAESLVPFSQAMLRNYLRI